MMLSHTAVNMFLKYEIRNSGIALFPFTRHFPLTSIGGDRQGCLLCDIPLMYSLIYV